MPRQATPLKRYGLAGLLLALPTLLLCYQAIAPNIITRDGSALPSASALATPVSTAASVAGSGANQRLKILIPSAGGVDVLTRQERELVLEFSSAESLLPEWISAGNTAAIRARLQQGDIDMVISVDNTLLEQIEGDVLYTLPWAVSRQQVIGRRDSNGNISLEDLAVRQVAIRRTSPAWPLLSRMAAQHSSMEILPVEEEVSTETILERVSSGEYDLAVVDSLSLPADIGFYYHVEAVLNLSDESFMTWGVPSGAHGLHRKLNRFLSRKHLETVIGRSYRDDFPEIKKRKLLRLITYRSPVNYFYEHGRFRGFEYDLVKRFAEQYGMRLDVVIAESHNEMLSMLNEGKGDVIAASVPEQASLSVHAVKLSNAYNYASPVIIGREDEQIVDLRDLDGRVVHLAPESPYREMLLKLEQRDINVTVLDAEQGMNTEAVLFGVAQGIYDLSVIASHEIKAELSRQINLRALTSLGDPEPLRWVVRNSNTQLLSALNSFIRDEYRKGFYNVVYGRYIDKPVARKADSRLFARIDQLSPYDDIVSRHADHYAFDWRLIVAQMYQESRFNPEAVSDAGASGLMQLLPSTAEMIGVENIRDPEKNIGGGIRYMDHLRRQFDADLTVEEQTWFTLAAYNAGYSRVSSARVLAASMNLDPNKWFNNVELAMLKMASPYMEQGRVIQLCRCGQTAAYVREIRTLYNNYLRLTQSVRAASRLEPRNEGS